MNTSFKQLLVHVDASPACRVRLDIACALARQQGAALAAIYAATSYTVAMTYPDPASADLLARMQQEDTQRRDRARAAFDAVAAATGVHATWGEVADEPVIGAVAQQSLFADLMVLGQHDASPDAGNDVPPDFAESVLATSGKPGLIVPYVGRFDNMGDTVVIAWKDTRESARAVAAALPLLQRAQRVHVLAWGSQPTAFAGATLNLEGYLQQHGVQAQWHREATEPDQVGDLLLSRASDLGASLLVMGCYGHSRMREWMLGGTSRTILRSMTLPILMAH